MLRIFVDALHPRRKVSNSFTYRHWEFKPHPNCPQQQPQWRSCRRKPHEFDFVSINGVSYDRIDCPVNAQVSFNHGLPKGTTAHKMFMECAAHFLQVELFPRYQSGVCVA